MARTPRPKPSSDLIRTAADRQALAEGCWFDEGAAEFAVGWIERFCTLTKARRAGQRVELLPWQRDIVRLLFGWKRRDGLRRYQSAYIEVAKKNGKSYLMSSIALFMLMADGESGAEVYLAAVNSKQARIIFDECLKMIKCCQDISKRLNPRDHIRRIEYPATFGKIECVTSDAGSQDGFDSSCTIFDELHRQRNSKLWSVFEHAGAAREQPLKLAITTAGQDRESVCWQEHERSRKILDGTSKDTSHLAVIYSADKDDAIDSVETWRKANPSLGETLDIKQFKRDLDKVRESPSGLNDFRRVRLNIWTEPDTAYIRPDVWARGSEPIDLEALRGKSCYGAFDLSSKKDLTAFALLFGDEIEGFKVIVHCWIPGDQAREREAKDGIPYTRWSREGWLTIIPGPVIDYDLVEAEIVAMSAPYRVLSMTSDDWGGSEAVGQRLARHGYKPAYMRQGFRSMSDPTKELERQALLGKFKHGGNPVLGWMNSNATVVNDAAGNIKLEKPGPASPFKIDGLIVCVEAMYSYLQAKRAKPNAYSTRKPDFVRTR